MAEIAIVSSRKSRLENSAQKGNKGAEVALELANAPNTFLSTVQIGITLIGILTGFFSGAGLSQELARYLAHIPVPLLQQYSQGIAIVVMVLLITFLSLVLGELVPKRIGMHNPEAIAAVMSRPMNILSKITGPLVWLLSVSTDGLLRLFRLKPSEEPAVTEEEVTSLIAQGTNLGVFEEVEQDIVERVFALSDRRVGSIMTNKLDVEWVDINDEFDIIKQTILQSEYSNFPVCRDSLDDVIGIINTKKFLQTLLQNEQVDWHAMVEKALFIPESMKAFRVLEQFKANKIRIAVVVDEFGTVQGLVSMKDLFEAMVGDLEEATEGEAEIVEREDGSYLIDALIPFDEFVSYFEIPDVDPEERAGFHTLGGLIFNIARQIPKTGEVFYWNGVYFEIVDMDGNRIDKILVRMQDGQEEHK